VGSSERCSSFRLGSERPASSACSGLRDEIVHRGHRLIPEGPERFLRGGSPKYAECRIRALLSTVRLWLTGALTVNIGVSPVPFVPICTRSGPAPADRSRQKSFQGLRVPIPRPTSVLGPRSVLRRTGSRRVQWHSAPVARAPFRIDPRLHPVCEIDSQSVNGGTSKRGAVSRPPSRDVLVDIGISVELACKRRKK
jgi:hypothetical protein